MPEIIVLAVKNPKYIYLDPQKFKRNHPDNPIKNTISLIQSG
jgi:hypothetical protein